MVKGETARRFLRILSSRRAGGRVLPGVVQLLLIVLWHLAMSFALGSIPFDRLTEKASYFWYRAGVTYSYQSDIRVVTYEDTSDAGAAFLLALTVYLAPMLIEVLLGWIGFRLIVRRPRPKWHRFVRFWWRTCLWGILAVPMVLTVGALSPWGHEEEGIFFLAGMGTYFCLVPALLAHREFTQRWRRIARICSNCRYWLHGISSEVCPECGTSIHFQRQDTSLVVLLRKTLTIALIICLLLLTAFLAFMLFSMTTVYAFMQVVPHPAMYAFAPKFTPTLYAGFFLIVLTAGVAGCWFVIRRRRQVLQSKRSPYLFILGNIVAFAVIVVFVMIHRDPAAAKRADAVLRLNMIQSGLTLFRWDAGSFPTTSQGLEVLLSKSKKWNCPYIPTRFQDLLDPWGRRYEYRCPGKFSHYTFDLWSKGPNGIDECEKDGSDDIRNWQ